MQLKIEIDLNELGDGYIEEAIQEAIKQAVLKQLKSNPAWKTLVQVQIDKAISNLTAK